jgi:hypothetical protein
MPDQGCPRADVLQQPRPEYVRRGCGLQTRVDVPHEFQAAAAITRIGAVESWLGATSVVAVDVLHEIRLALAAAWVDLCPSGVENHCPMLDSVGAQPVGQDISVRLLLFSDL